MGVAGQLIVQPDRNAWTAAAVERFVAASRAAIEDHGRFLVALAGGSTPRGLYEALAGDAGNAIDWASVVLILGDERCLPLGDPGRNLTMVTEALLAPRSLTSSQVVPLYDGTEPRASLTQARRWLVEMLGGDPSSGPPLQPLDLVLLGLGENCHTASLFPGLPWSLERSAWVVAEYVEVVGQWRLSLTPLVLREAAEIIFLIEGAAKAHAVVSVLEDPVDPTVRPAQAFVDCAQVTWLLDESAARQLPDSLSHL